MDVEDAIIASNFINCNKVIGVHYNTFPVISIESDDAFGKFKAANKELFLPAIGETITL